MTLTMGFIFFCAEGFCIVTAFLSLTDCFLWLAGGEVIRYFAFAMMVGILIGTYSSMFVASPVVVALHNRYGESKSR